ncbi:MAG: hypothetical protein J6Y76_02550 [Paludibacteraceae bacterium]|nr:hypothetical protein [Paludibacteraceae bacterium]
MIYRLTFMNEEVDAFKRVFEADPDATFLDLHKALLASVGYTDDQMTAFYICNSEWERVQEITLVPMPDTDQWDNMTMEATKLSDLLTEPKQRLMYVFDPMMDRNFFGSLNSIKEGHVEGIQLTESKGKAPKQIKEDDIMNLGGGSSDDLDLDSDFYGSDNYDEGDLDMEGFQDLSFEDGTMF